MQKLLNSEHRNLKKLSMINDYASESCQIDSITTDNLHYYLQLVYHISPMRMVNEGPWTNFGINSSFKTYIFYLCVRAKSRNFRCWNLALQG